MSDLFNFGKTDFSYLKGTSDTPTAPPPVAPVAKPKAETQRPYMSGSFWQKAFDTITTPLNAFGGFLTGAYNKSKEQAPAVKAGKESVFTAVPKSIWAGIQNVPTGVTQRISPGGYLKNTFSPDQTGALKDVTASPVTQFAADVTADPLNFLPIEKMAQGLKFVAQRTPVVKNVLSGASGLTKSVKELPVVRGVIDNLGKKFIKGYGLPEDVVKAFDKAPLEAGLKTEDIIAKQKALFNWGTKQQLTKQEIEAVAKFLEPKGAGAGTDLAALRKSLGSRFDDVIAPILKQEREITQQLVLDAAKRGNISSEAAKNYLKGGYFPHNLWEEGKGVSGFGSKIGVRQGYYKARKGVEGFLQNTPEAVAKRQIEQVRDNAIQDAIRFVKDKYGKTVETFGSKVNNATVPEGYRMVTGTHTRLKDLWNTALPNNIADYLDQTLKESQGWQKALDSFNRVWKPTATSMNPGFHLTNMLGNMYNSFLGGVSNPKRFFQMVTGNFSKEEEALAHSSGILTRGEFYGNPAKQAFGKTIEKIASSPNLIGGWIENNARKALFLDSYNKLIGEGISHQEALTKAVNKVDKFLFNYQTALTPFENNIMKRFFPFYTWARKNIPLQAETLYKQTAKPAAALKTINAINQGEMPEDLSVPAGKDEMGKDLRYKVGLPLQDLATPLNPASGRDMLNPVIKEIMNVVPWMATGGKVTPSNWFTGQQYTRPGLPMSEQVRDVAGAEATNLFRPARTVQKIWKNKTFGNAIRSLMGGFSTPQTEEQQFMNEQYDKKDRISALKAEIKQAIKDGDLEKAKRLEQMLP